MEWSFFLGKLFSTVMETQFDSKVYSPSNCYEDSERTVDDKIKEMLSKFDVMEKLNIGAFLLAATSPLTQDRIEGIASKLG